MNLNNLRILVTRPYGEELCADILKHHGQPIYLPIIKIEYMTDALSSDHLAKQMAQQDWLIFASQAAVYASIDAIKPYLSAQTKIAAMGEGTAKALREAKVTVTLLPPVQWSSEGLLAMPELQVLTNQRILLVRGEGGRELLATTLKTRGATVSDLIVYRRLLPEIDAEHYLPLFQQHKIDVIICTSQTAIDHIQQLVGAIIHQVPVVVSSMRLQDYAKKQGFDQIIIAENAGNTAILQALAASSIMHSN